MRLQGQFLNTVLLFFLLVISSPNVFAVVSEKSKPNPDFREDLADIYKRFCQVHGENELSKENGIITGFAEDMAQLYSQYDFKVIKMISRSFTTIRKRKINELIELKKFQKNKEKPADNPYPSLTKRGKNFLARVTTQ